MRDRLRLRRGEPRHGQRSRACSGTGPAAAATHRCAGLVPFPRYRVDPRRGRLDYAGPVPLQNSMQGPVSCGLAE